MSEADKTSEAQKPPPGDPKPPAKRSDAALRALAEAAERRAEGARRLTAPAKEVPSRDGPDPTRYGDWESKGMASDF